MFCYQDMHVFVFLTIPWFTKSVTSWDRVHFWIYLLNHNSSCHQTWPIDRYKQGQQLSTILWTICMTGTKFKVFSNLAICSNYSITSYIKITLFYFFEKKNKGQLKMQGFNLPSHMLHNVIFPTETNFPIRSKYVFYFIRGFSTWQRSYK